MPKADPIVAIPEAGPDLRPGNANFRDLAVEILKARKAGGATIQEMVENQVGDRSAASALCRRKFSQALAELKDLGVAQAKGPRWFWWRWAP